MASFDCLSWFPVQLCTYSDELTYLVPSLLLAIVFRVLTRQHPIFFAFYLSGTILHELAHFFTGLVTNARPVRFSIFPRRGAGNQWILGSVSFANIRWYNAAFVGLAPVLILLVPFLIALIRIRTGQPFGWLDVGITVLIAPAFLSFLPSRIDVLIALRSWPYIMAAGLWLWWIWR